MKAGMIESFTAFLFNFNATEAFFSIEKFREFKN